MKVKRPELSLLKKIFMVDLIKGLLALVQGGEVDGGS